MMTHTKFYQHLLTKIAPFAVVIALLMAATLVTGCGQRAPLEKPDGYIEDSHQY